MNVCGCFAPLGPGRLFVIDGTMNSAPYQKILMSGRQFGTSNLRVVQQDNDLKQTSKWH